MKRRLELKLGISMHYFESAKILFNERCEEMDTFLKNSSNLAQNNPYDRNFEHILKSNCILMQYNILESSFLELFNNLYDFLKNCDISIDSLNSSFSYYIYSLIKRQNKNKHEQIKLRFNNNGLNFSRSTISLCFDLDEEEKKFLLNGNIDGKKIKELLQNFGINIEKLENLDLREIKIIKDCRQHLAHGASSFSEIGKTISWDTLKNNSSTIKELFTESTLLLESFCESLHQEHSILAS